MQMQPLHTFKANNVREEKISLNTNQIEMIFFLIFILIIFYPRCHCGKKINEHDHKFVEDFFNDEVFTRSLNKETKRVVNRQEKCTRFTLDDLKALM